MCLYTHTHIKNLLMCFSFSQKAFLTVLVKSFLFKFENSFILSLHLPSEQLKTTSLPSVSFCLD